jgi:3alpha(or 20beta)-hydroxysteroid dehydrogenase
MGMLDGKVAIITGAAVGQGAAEAEYFVREGAQVVLSDLRAEVALVRINLGDAVRSVQMDVGNERDWDGCVRHALSEFGRIDVLINNAGLHRHGPLVDASVETFDELYRVNQRGVFLGMRSVAGPMSERGGGSIVNVSSAAALSGSLNGALYSATKWAVRGLSRSAALEFARSSIRVNTIFPGPIDTPMLREDQDETVVHRLTKAIPVRRIGTPSEIAAAAAFLASDAASFITGAELAVDGGLSA